MKLIIIVTAVSGLAAAAPALVNLGAVLPSNALRAVHTSATTKAPSVATPAASSATAHPSITIAPSAASVTYPTAFPSSFSAPVQGQGKLALDNLPALPPVLDKTLVGVLGVVVGLVSGVCSAEYKCTISVAGSIQSLLVDGDDYSAATSVTAWCDAGRCFGAADAPVTATAPFEITCDQLTGTSSCSATISGAADAIFTNGQQVEVWGWLTPAGSCHNGICTASISAFGDPMY